jgi:hypothetical protein
MPTEQDIVGILEAVRIDWEATPQSVLGPQSAITSQEDFERSQRALRDDVGRAYFFVNVYDMRADLALMRCTRPGRWETEIIPQELSPLLEEDLERAIEEAGGALTSSGHYPLSDTCLWKLKASYLGA